MFDQILKFDDTQADAIAQRNHLVDLVVAAYQKNFNTLYPLIAFVVARTVDFNELSTRGRAAVQQIEDRTSKLEEKLQKQAQDAEDVLRRTRAAAEQQGVSQEAKHFSRAANTHDEWSKKWKIATWWFAGVLGAYSVISFFLHKIPWIAPTDVPTAIQFAISKFLVFFVLSFLLFLSSRNFLSHRHNYIVNKHRQDALMTYNALVDAGGTEQARETVLHQAAAAIYGSHATGYVKQQTESGVDARSFVQLLTRQPLTSSDQ